MTIKDLRTFSEFEVYIDYIKQNRKKSQLHPIAEQNLRILLSEICPESHPVNESNVDGGRVDLIYYFDSLSHTIHFEIFASYSTVIKDLRHLEQTNFDIQVAILIDKDIDSSVFKKYFREKPTNPFPFFNLSQIFIDTKIGDFKREIENLIKIFKNSLESPDTIKGVGEFRIISPSKEDLLDLDDIKYCITKLKKKHISPKSEKRALKDITNKLLDIAYIKTLREESKIVLKNLLKFLFDYMQGRGESTIISILEIVSWICRSEMQSTAKSIYYEYLVSLLDEKKRYSYLLETLFRFGHFHDRVFWLSTAIDEKNIDFINILTSDQNSLILFQQRLEIRDMLYEKLDMYEKDDEYQEIIKKIHFLLELLNDIKK